MLFRSLGTVTGTVAGAVLGVLTRRGAAALTDVAAKSGRPKVPSVQAIRP